MVSISELFDRDVVTCTKTVSKKIKYKFSIRSDIGIITGSDLWNRNKTITNTSSTGKVMVRREKKTTND